VADGHAGERRPRQRVSVLTGTMAKVRHGALVFEHYFSGSDEILGRPVGEVAFGPNTLHDERSISNSVVALVVGIAIDHGLIKNIDQPIMSFFSRVSGSADVGEK
jgi:CubicO group peptidase (beta-lactamase class C family)